MNIKNKKLQPRKRLKKFIKEFNFPDPKWNNLPEDFPNCSREGLTTEECHLLEAIEIAWMITEKGRAILYKKFLHLSLVIIAIGTIGLLGINILTNPDGKYAKSVNAATISATLKRVTTSVDTQVEDVIESTMSAVRLRR